MEEALRNGADPKRKNAFACALIHCAAARPLLSFYRRMRSEFPVLDDQASLALAIAARERKARVAAMLAWAGADPFRKVPYDLEEDNWDFANDDSVFTITAAEDAVSSGKVEIIKSLKLKPTIEQARRLLGRISWNPSRELLHSVLAVLPDQNLNISERESCPALEALVERRLPLAFGNRSPEEENKCAVECIEELLDSGARWNPPSNRIPTIRRCILDHEALYIVRIIRLLLYTTGACDPAYIRDLCRTPTIRQRINSVDKPLSDELIKLTRKRRK